MRSIDLAFEDIKLVIRSDIVHKYLLSNAPDMIAIANLARLCDRYSNDLFAWVAAIAHAMVNPRVIEELSDLIQKSNGNKQFLWSYVTLPATKERWNSPEFHAEMKAVTSDYQKQGGYQLGDIHSGVAAKFFHPDFTKQLDELTRIVSNWLYAQGAVKEDDLIQAIFNLNVPGMHDEADKEKGYWLLHFCRWISFARNTVFHLPVIESERYFDMIGVRIFRNHYTNLVLSDMPELFERCKIYISQFELSHGRPDPKITFGDFGCLTCEAHRTFDQLRKELKCETDNEVRQILQDKLQTPEDLTRWLHAKEANTDHSKGPSIVNSARYNSTLFARFKEQTQHKRPRSPVVDYNKQASLS